MIELGHRAGDRALRPVPVVCDGDCNLNATVTVEELVRAVIAALDGAAPVSCDAVDLDGGGLVTVDELVRAVGRALQGCPAA